MAGTVLPRTPSAHNGSAVTARLLVQYVGFQDAPDRREYVLLAQFGETVRQYTVWIARDAFDKRRALLQDGPDICYQKLMRALGDESVATTGRLAVTDADLTRYREAHAPPARRPPGTRNVI